MQVLDVDLDKERISLSLKATQVDPWQEFATNHRVGELVYGRITKLVPFGAFVQVGDGIEGLVHISEMAAHHVDLPEQVVTPGEELWVKIIDIDLQRRRISLSIKQAAEGGVVAEEYQEAFGEHAYDEQGNYIGSYDYTTEFTPRARARPRGRSSLPQLRPRQRLSRSCAGSRCWRRRRCGEVADAEVYAVPRRLRPTSLRPRAAAVPAAVAPALKRRWRSPTRVKWCPASRSWRRTQPANLRLQPNRADAGPAGGAGGL